MKSNSTYIIDPYGMTMSGRHGQAADGYRYGFNGMEADDEIKNGDKNSYDFGARMYDPIVGRWLSTDKMENIYASTSTYCYALNSPIIAKDKSGLYTIFVNGYIYGPVDPFKRCEPGWQYWRSSTQDPSQFINAAHDYFNDGISKFVNGTGESSFSTAESRMFSGYQTGKLMAKDLIAEIQNNPEIKELNIVSHSMGAAYSEGMIAAFMEHPELAELLKKGEVVHFSACDADKITLPPNSLELNRTQINYTGDYTLSWADSGSEKTGGFQIPGVEKMGVVQSDLNVLHPKASGQDWDFHFDTKTFKEAWNAVKVLNEKIENNPTLKGNPVEIESTEIKN